jgi:positive regulator of sigma E activity
VIQESLVEQGLVVDTHPEKGVLVQFGEGGDCDGCPAESLCKGDKEQGRLWVPSKGDYEVGDLVSVQIEGRDLLLSSALVFALPLVLALLSISILFYMLPASNTRPLIAALGASISICIGWFVAYRMQKAGANASKFRTKIQPR